MTTTNFDTISHADFLRLTLEAFSRLGYTVEQSSDVGADGVLVGRTGQRIGILCKKYRGAFIGRPVLLQFYGSMRQLGCTSGYLITTTDCTPEAYDFASGKGIVLYNRERTTALLRTAFGDEFIRSGSISNLGTSSTAVPAAARQMSSAASYEKVAAEDRKKAPEPARPQVPPRSPAPVQPPKPVQPPESAKAPEPVNVPEPAKSPQPVQAPEPSQGTELHKAPEPGQAPPEKMAGDELPEEVQEVESLDPPGIPAAAPSEHTTTIVCLECNKQLQVPIDQGMITVQCPECGMRRIYQPELNEAGELKTTTIISCRSCSQKLNVPTNRGQLKVRCPQCKAAWVFTP